MAEVSGRTKRIVGEIGVLIFLTYIWGVRSLAVDTSSVKAGILKQVVKVDRDNVQAYRFLAEFYRHSRPSGLGSRERGELALHGPVKWRLDDGA